MTNYELKKAFYDEAPVVFKGIEGYSKDIEYKYISAIIYRKRNKKLVISAELVDKCGHSVSIVSASRLILARK